MFRFADILLLSQGTLQVRILSPKNELYFFNVDVVHAEIPCPLGSADTKTNVMLLKYLDDVLEHRNYRCPIPITYIKNTYFRNGTTLIFSSHGANWSDFAFTFYTPTSISYSRFYNQRDPKLLNINKPKRVVQEIADACDQCRELSVKHFCFRASILSNQLIFNLEVATDLRWLKQSPILHVMNTH